LMLTLNRKTHRARNRTIEGNFSIEGLMGFDMHGKNVGVAGTGKIGRCLIDILLGFGCNVLAFDKYPAEELKQRKGVRYVELEELLKESDIISLHLPLLPSTKHVINEAAIANMKPGVMIINTSRGGLVDTKALIDGLKSKKIGSAGLDVYEDETAYFFADHSEQGIQDNVLARLISFNNVILTGHQAWFTHEAMDCIARTTFDNIMIFAKEGKKGSDHPNFVRPEYS